MKDGEAIARFFAICKYLGVGDHICGGGVIMIEEDKAHNETTVWFTNGGTTHNPLFSRAYAIDFSNNGEIVMAYQTALSLWPVREKAKQIRIVRDLLPLAESAILHDYSRISRLWRKLHAMLRRTAEGD
jgi:hypothetical protein